MAGASNQCTCASCSNERNARSAEDDLHAFVGLNAPNIKRGLGEFEDGLMFLGVAHWNVGYSDRPRYYVYMGPHGEMVAWYDNVNKRGYRSSQDKCSKRD